MPGSDDRAELLAANQRFYDAFARGDFVAMDALWSERDSIVCIHPGWTLLRGRDRVLASWRGILRNPNPIQMRDPVVELCGEVGLILCTEVLPEAELAASNLFVREAGRWRMLHHHAGLVGRRTTETVASEDVDDDDPLLN
ncbi:nuclear transport factor 2 family protein [Nannocystaceae bacterium ST9]